MSEPHRGGPREPESDEGLEPPPRLRNVTDARARERILDAVLRVCGERGYRKTTVKDVLEPYGGYRLEFYNHFANKAECYAAAYEREVERLLRRLLGACKASESWREGLGAALAELAAYVSEDQYLAAGLLVEAHVAPDPVGARRAEVFERLTRAIDGARRETSASRHSPPPITASFILSAIEQTVVGALARRAPEDFAAAVPALEWLGVTLYFGEAPEAGLG